MSRKPFEEPVQLSPPFTREPTPGLAEKVEAVVKQAMLDYRRTPEEMYLHAAMVLIHGEGWEMRRPRTCTMRAQRGEEYVEYVLRFNSGNPMYFASSRKPSNLEIPEPFRSAEKLK